ncbi:unnamed protein product [Enterobius vermicularis]|uniref:CC domain-containing protein n=1 Tax=Enterobius vermicularis TaxID=51028 RepID=A0A0N4UZK5_ENTVE|nr:unnamed protein product [Enterobius vermicularis]
MSTIFRLTSVILLCSTMTSEALPVSCIGGGCMPAPFFTGNNFNAFPCNGQDCGIPCLGSNCPMLVMPQDIGGILPCVGPNCSPSVPCIGSNCLSPQPCFGNNCNFPCNTPDCLPLAVGCVGTNCLPSSFDFGGGFGGIGGGFGGGFFGSPCMGPNCQMINSPCFGADCMNLLPCSGPNCYMQNQFDPCFGAGCPPLCIGSNCPLPLTPLRTNAYGPIPVQNPIPVPSGPVSAPASPPVGLTGSVTQACTGSACPNQVVKITVPKNSCAGFDCLIDIYCPNSSCTRK